MASIEIDASAIEDTTSSLEAFQRALAGDALASLYSELAQGLARAVGPLFPSLTGAAQRGVRASGDSVIYEQPYMDWLDFGGRVGIHGSVERPVLQTGRYLYPTLSRLKGEDMDAAQKALDALANQHGLEVS